MAEEQSVLGRALECLRKATEADSRLDVALALTLYRDGTDLLVKAAAAEKDPNRRGLFTAKAAEYRARQTALEVALAGSERSAVVSMSLPTKAPPPTAAVGGSANEESVDDVLASVIGGVSSVAPVKEGEREEENPGDREDRELQARLAKLHSAGITGGRLVKPAAAAAFDESRLMTEEDEVDEIVRMATDETRLRQEYGSDEGEGEGEDNDDDVTKQRKEKEAERRRRRKEKKAVAKEKKRGSGGSSDDTSDGSDDSSDSDDDGSMDDMERRQREYFRQREHDEREQKKLFRKQLRK